MNSFEAWIRIGGVEDITFAYGSVTSGDLGFLTVGAKDKTGTVGDNYYYNGSGTLPAQGTQLAVTTTGCPVQAVPEPPSSSFSVLDYLDRRDMGGRSCLRSKSICNWTREKAGSTRLCLFLFISFANHQLQGQPPIVE